LTSLVIPALDDDVALRQNLPRLAALEGDKELIVADGGGNDEARPVADSLGARWVQCDVGRGPQMNAAAAQARGDELLFVHADAWLDGGALVEARRALAREGVAVATFRQRIEGERRAYRWIERAASWRARVLRCPYGDSGLFLRRADFERIGGFPDLPICEDLGIARRLRRLGRLVVVAARVHVSPRRWERHGVVKATLLNWGVAGAFLSGVAPERLYRMYYGRALGNGAREIVGPNTRETGMDRLERRGGAHGARP
jgi:rSAM/selenodomain-associated transferase 2